VVFLYGIVLHQIAYSFCFMYLMKEYNHSSTSIVLPRREIKDAKHAVMIIDVNVLLNVEV